MNTFCAPLKIVLLATLIGVGALARVATAADDAVPAESAQLAHEDDQRSRYGLVRDSVTHFVHVDGSQVTRRSLSEDERAEMRRQIDEAIRKAYPERRRGSD